MAAKSPATIRTLLAQFQCRLTLSSCQQSAYTGILCTYQQKRWGRASRSQYKLREDWHTQKWSHSIKDVGLTRDNEQFVKQVIHDTYKQDSPLRDEPWQRGEFQKYTRRCGVLALKIGVLPQWTQDGQKFYTTLLQVLDNHVIRYTPPEHYKTYSSWKPQWGKWGSVVVGALSCDPRMFKKSYNQLFEEAGVPPKKKLTRFLVTPNSAIQPGTRLTAMHFRVGDYVDVQAKTIDHGFQGVVKRWGMKGMPASHGVTKAHRKMGSTGGGGNKAAIWKGKHMPGHMGNRWRILKGLKIWRINTKYNVLYVTGPNLPGNTHGFVRVYDTILPAKRPTPENHPPMPTWYPEDSEEAVVEELWDEELFRFSEPSIQHQESA